MIAKIKTAEAGVTFSDSTDEEIVTLFRYLFALIGLNKKFFPQELEINILVACAKDTLKNVSMDDLRLSFQLAVEKRTEVDLRLFGDTFSHRMVMEVYDAFKKYKFAMKTQLIKPPTPDETTKEERLQMIKNGALSCFETYKETGELYDFGNITYNYIDSIGLIKLTKEEKSTIFDKCKEALIAGKKQSADKRTEVRKAVELITSGKASSVASESKRYALKQYFKELIEFEINLKELIK